MRFDGPFTPGSSMRGVIAPTTVDPDVAAAQKPYEGKAFEITVEEMEPERVLSFRWHPFAVDECHDYSLESSTLVRFTLEDVPDGVLLTVTESGFEGVPLERRAKALEANEGGWEMQMKLIEKYLAHAP